MTRPAVIVINSLVARGGVGGRAAVFALEKLGFPVWSVPTVQLPWHPGHGRATRMVPEAATFAAFVGDLAAAPLLDEVGAVLTGYLGEAAQVEPVVRLIEAAKARNPALIHLADPVVGDAGRLFQPETLARAIGDRLLPLADIVTSNRFEVGWYAGADVSDNDALVAAARRSGRREAVVTSAFAGEGEIGNLAVARGEVHLATHALVPAAPKGTGDLFAALYLAHRLLASPPPDALRLAAAGALRMVEAAAALGVDELPFAAAGDVLTAPPAGVRLRRL